MTLSGLIKKANIMKIIAFSYSRIIILTAGLLSACTSTSDLDPAQVTAHSDITSAVTTQLSQPLQPAVDMAPSV
jgi:hypothetical protein